MMTSSNENISALLAIYVGNSPVTGEFPTQRLVTRRFDVFFDLRLNKRLSKPWWGWWFETPSRPLWRHCNEIRSACSVNSFGVCRIYRPSAVSSPSERLRLCIRAFYEHYVSCINASTGVFIQCFHGGSWWYDQRRDTGKSLMDTPGRGLWFLIWQLWCSIWFMMMIFRERFFHIINYLCGDLPVRRWPIKGIFRFRCVDIPNRALSL